MGLHRSRQSDAAKRFTARLGEEFSLLAREPRIGPICDELTPELRSFSTGNYIIFYRIAPEHIEIVRILHGARDIETIFEEEPTE